MKTKCDCSWPVGDYFVTTRPVQCKTTIGVDYSDWRRREALDLGGSGSWSARGAARRCDGDINFLLEALVEPRCLALCRPCLGFLLRGSLEASSAASAAVAAERRLSLMWWPVSSSRRSSCGGVGTGDDSPSGAEVLCLRQGGSSSAILASACVSACRERRRVSSVSVGWWAQSLRRGSPSCVDLRALLSCSLFCL